MMPDHRPLPERLPLDFSGRMNVIDSYRRIYGLSLAEAVRCINVIGFDAAREAIQRQNEGNDDA